MSEKNFLLNFTNSVYSDSQFSDNDQDILRALSNGIEEVSRALRKNRHGPLLIHCKKIPSEGVKQVKHKGKM